VTDAEHPTSDLDEVVHQRARLGILTILADATEADFTFLARTLDLTPGNLGRHLEVLARAGFVIVKKGSDGRRQRTWIAITNPGRLALQREISALRALVAYVDTATGS
jgi:DNA-binding MarR family transcriptional regulator